MSTFGPLLLVAVLVVSIVAAVRRRQGKPVLAQQSTGARVAYVVIGLVVVLAGLSLLSQPQ